MERKRYIPFFLLVVSLLMMAVPVFPHHHHANGLLCMKNDIGPHCCQQHPSETGSETHCCCETGCIAHHFFQQMPTDMRTSPHPAVSELIPFLSPLLLRLAASRAIAPKGDIPIYIESLHGTLIAHATGLRAPPVSLLF